MFLKIMINTLLTGIYRRPTQLLIHTPGFLSLPFNLDKYTRQGCSLLPLLFDLALPLARFLEDLFQGLKQVKLAMFADDIILFIANPPKILTCHLPADHLIWDIFGL